MSPMPDAEQRHRRRERGVGEVGLIGGEEREARRRQMIARPARTMVRTGNRADSRDPTADARNIAIETGSILTPVSRASRPRTSCR